MTPRDRIEATRAKPWLPPSALEGGVAEPALNQAIARWSSDWFASVSLKLRKPLQRSDETGGVWRVSDAGLALPASETTDVAVVQLLLGQLLDAGKLRSIDRKLIRKWSGRCLEHLGCELAKACGVMRSPDWHAGRPDELGQAWSLSVGTGEKEIANILIASDPIIQLIRKQTPSEVPTAPLSARSAAVEQQGLAISAFIGRCRLSLADLESLGEGDVLCLDAQTSAPVALAIENTRSADLCTIEQDGGALALRLVQ